MSSSIDLENAIAHLQALRAIMEPGGGVIDTRAQPPARVRQFMRLAANATWLLGISMENILMGAKGRLDKTIL